MSEHELQQREPPTVDPEDLADHPQVYDVEDVSVGGGPRVLNVQFTTRVLPTAFQVTDHYRIRNVWVGTVPPWYLRRVASDWCLHNGIGRPACAAEIEVIA